ncbi:MAG: hypothetical protein AAFZ52_03120 [Bacteroidota bacterium]
MSAIPINQACLRPTPAKNFDLEPADFHTLVADLREGDHRLFERVFLHHFADCCGYLHHADGATEDEATNVVMDTLLRFRELLVAGKLHYGNLRFLFTRMARQELTRRRRHLHRVEMALEGHHRWQEHTFTEEEYAALKRAFRLLGVSCRQLLIKFYYQNRSLNAIAAEENRQAAAVRKQKSRCVTRLRKFFYPKGQSIEHE